MAKSIVAEILADQVEGLIDSIKQELNVTLRLRGSFSDNVTLGVVMIVKNEENCLEGCLKSVEGVDEIVILDTGSTDKTGEIARRYTDKYFANEYEWNDNFAEARNLALDKCTTDWVISIDADERLDEGGVQKIREVIQDPNTYQNAMLVLMHNGNDQFYNNKVFRSDLRYHGRVHEYVVPSHTVPYCGVGIEFNISQSHQSDPDRNIRILEASARQDPFDPRLHYCMGREYFIMGYYPNAIYWFERYKSNDGVKLFPRWLCVMKK
jgi:glycosyltransferase involved in cell wall biosynthesis